VGSEIYAHIVYTFKHVLKQTHTSANTIKWPIQSVTMLNVTFQNDKMN
jgi:hypothetical protein